MIPDGQVWVMGDNRTQSEDSRYFGPIEQSTIVGRAFVRLWPLEPPRRCSRRDAQQPVRRDGATQDVDVIAVDGVDARVEHARP